MSRAKRADDFIAAESDEPAIVPQNEISRHAEILRQLNSYLDLSQQTDLDFFELQKIAEKLQYKNMAETMIKWLAKTDESQRKLFDYQFFKKVFVGEETTTQSFALALFWIKKIKPELSQLQTYHIANSGDENFKEQILLSWFEAAPIDFKETQTYVADFWNISLNSSQCSKLTTKIILNYFADENYITSKEELEHIINFQLEFFDQDKLIKKWFKKGENFDFKELLEIVYEIPETADHETCETNNKLKTLLLSEWIKNNFSAMQENAVQYSYALISLIARSDIFSADVKEESIKNLMINCGFEQYYLDLKQQLENNPNLAKTFNKEEFLQILNISQLPPQTLPASSAAHPSAIAIFPEIHSRHF